MLKKIIIIFCVAILFVATFSSLVLALNDDCVYEFYSNGDKIITDTPIDRWGKYVPVRAFFENAECRVDWRREEDGSISALIFWEEKHTEPYFVFNTNTRKIIVEGSVIDAGGEPPIIRNDRMQVSTYIIANDFMDRTLFYDENGIIGILKRIYLHGNMPNTLKSLTPGGDDQIVCKLELDENVDINGSAYVGQKIHFTGSMAYRGNSFYTGGYFDKGKFVIYKRDNPDVIVFVGKIARGWGVSGEFYDEESKEHFVCEFVVNN